jgi:hypothetical protein
MLRCHTARVYERAHPRAHPRAGTPQDRVLGCQDARPSSCRTLCVECNDSHVRWERSWGSAAIAHALPPRGHARAEGERQRVVVLTGVGAAARLQTSGPGGCRLWISISDGCQNRAWRGAMAAAVRPSAHRAFSTPHPLSHPLLPSLCGTFGHAGRAGEPQPLKAIWTRGRAGEPQLDAAAPCGVPQRHLCRGASAEQRDGGPQRTNDGMNCASATLPIQRGGLCLDAHSLSAVRCRLGFRPLVPKGGRPGAQFNTLTCTLLCTAFGGSHRESETRGAAVEKGWRAHFRRAWWHTLGGQPQRGYEERVREREGERPLAAAEYHKPPGGTCAPSLLAATRGIVDRRTRRWARLAQPGQMRGIPAERVAQ